MALSAGIIVGPLIGDLLLRHDPTYRLPFFVGGAICAVLLVITIVCLGEGRPSPPQEQRRAMSTFAGYRVALLKNDVGVSPGTVGLLISLYAVSGTLVQYPLVRRLRDATR